MSDVRYTVDLDLEAKDNTAQAFQSVNAKLKEAARAGADDDNSDRGARHAGRRRGYSRP